jgi:putative spermidine/putrescine transport system ATP-binding protein
VSATLAFPAPAAAAARAPAAPIVRLAGVRKSFGSFVALTGIDLEIRRGEFFTLLGPSGSGKTTTLRLIAGFEVPDAGRIELDGRDVARLPPHARDVNTVFQDYALFPHMSVLENVAYGLEARGMKRRDAIAPATEALRMVRLEELAGRRPGQLSGGQRQRVALARAIVNRPQVLLLDEPLGALDLKLRQEMQVELKRIQQQVGLTFLYVTHDQEEALTMSDRIAVFDHGRIAQVGTPVEVYERPRTEYVATFVGISNLLLRDGRKVALRPEKIRLAPTADAPSAGGRTAAGVVRAAVYAGALTRYIVALDDGTMLTVLEPNAEMLLHGPGFAEGQRVVATWRAENECELDAG